MALPHLCSFTPGVIIVNHWYFCWVSHMHWWLHCMAPGHAGHGHRGRPRRRRDRRPFAPRVATRMPKRSSGLQRSSWWPENDAMQWSKEVWSQTSDNMDRWKAEQGRGREKRKIRRKKIRRERVRRKKMQMREKVGKSRNTVFFQWFVAPEGRKVGSLKRRVRSQLARWEMKKCTPLWREAHFQVKIYKTPQRRTTFGSCNVEKVHAVVARSTFPSQNVQNTSGPDRFWKLRCRKSARRCGAKSTFRSENVQSTPFSDHFWKLRCLKSARRCGAKHISKSKC